MDQIYFLQDMAIVMAVSAVIMIFCQRFRLPVVLGYILAGFFIGPHTPPFPLITDLHSIHTLSELGVIFLLFSIGLEFSLPRLAKVGIVSFIAASLEIILMIWIGYTLGRAFGWSPIDSIFLGAILSISSTTIIAKILLEKKIIQEKFAQVILGILVIEDLLAIIIIALLSGIAASGSLEMHEVAVAMLKVMSFVLAVLFFGLLLVPRILRYISRFNNSEMLVITVLGLCFGVSFAAAKFGFSVALGAFLIGAIIAETQQVREIIHKMEPLRDMFTAIFFVSVGMLISPEILVRFWSPILIITVVTVLGKVFSCSFATFLTGYRGETALKVGLGLAQIGEFSFIIARQGDATGVTSAFLYPIAVSVSAITTLTTPFLMDNTPSITHFFTRVIPKPLQTFFYLYTAWFEKLGGVRSERSTMIREGLRFYLPRLFFYVASALALFYGLSIVQTRFHLFPGNTYWIAAGVTILPLFTGFVYTLDRILWNVLFLNLIGAREEMIHAEDAHRTLHNAFRFFMVFNAGIIFLVVGSRFLPRLPLFMAVASLLVISGLYLWGSARKLHERMEKLVLGIFDKEKPEPQVQNTPVYENLVRLIREEYPWDVTTEDFLLPYKESAVNQTLKNLRLRSETGTSVVAIYRDTESLVNPSPEAKLLPGDVLLLMGDPDQIKKATQYLSRKVKEPLPAEVKDHGTPRTRSFAILPDSPWLGKSVRETKLRRKTGATILGIQKGAVTLNNPNPDTVIEENDTLVLFGWPKEIESAVSYLSKL